MNTLIPPPLALAIIAVLMWALDRVLVQGQIVTAFNTPVAVVLLAAGLALMALAAMQFIRAKTTINPMRPARATALMVSGVFKLSRNPIYLADLLILAAFCVWLGNVINVLMLVFFVCYIARFQIEPEERALRTLFGETYSAYCANVRRWL